MQAVVLGSAMDLHTGIHAALVAAPPSGIRYQVRAARHVFLHRRGGKPFSPIAGPHAGEFVDFGRGPTLVHSAWWPVLNRSAWVVDLDELGYPVLVGRTGLSAGYRTRFRSRWSRAFAVAVHRRVRTMLEAYCHPSCRGILFQTRFGAAQAVDYLQAFECGDLIEAFVDKSYVVYPATTALAERDVQAKWRSAARLRAVFCGRDFAAKEGELALRVIGRLQAAGVNLDFTYIGAVPPWAASRHRATLERIDVVDSAARAAVLAHLASGHVLFHPSPNESVGMVLIEAAAAGLAIVCSEGRSLAHLSELFPRRGLRTVNRNRGSAAAHERAFIDHLTRLASAPSEARAMAVLNHRRASSGPISVAHRNALLARIYRKASAAADAGPLTLAPPLRASSLTVRTISPDRLQALIAASQADSWPTAWSIAF